MGPKSSDFGLFFFSLNKVEHRIDPTSRIKEIAALCEINNDVTFHVARHTFATTITLDNGVPIESVSKMLGRLALVVVMVVLETPVPVRSGRVQKQKRSPK